MNDYKTVRANSINRWALKPSQLVDDSEFNVINIFTGKVRDNGNLVYVPLKVSAKDDLEYNILLSHILEALDLLPYKVDLSFDFFWKTFERHAKRKSGQNITETLKQQAIQARKKTDQVSVLLEVVRSLYDVIPTQACEYIVKLVKKHKIGITLLSNQKSFYRRLIGYSDSGIEFESMHHFLLAADRKYGYSPDDQRKFSTLLLLYLRGNEVELEGNRYKISDEARLSFLLSGLLYTYRNERVHGENIAPFKSSTAKQTTVCFCYFNLISIGALLAILVFKDYGYSLDELKTNCIVNIENFRRLFGKTIEK